MTLKNERRAEEFEPKSGDVKEVYCCTDCDGTGEGDNKSWEVCEGNARGRKKVAGRQALSRCRRPAGGRRATVAYTEDRTLPICSPT